MKVIDFLLSLYQQGITIQVEQENLKISAPKGVLSPEIQNQLREGKAEIIAFLLEEQAVRYTNIPLRRVDRRQPKPVSFAQLGLWLQYQLEGQSDTYNLPFVYRLSGELDIAALEKSLRYLIARHEALRTSFKSIDGEPYQVVAESVDWKLDVREADGEAAMLELFALAREPFSLKQAPLMRAHLWTHPQNKYTLLLNFHHIITDGWSQEVLKRELANVYSQYAAGVGAALPPLELDYTDYAAWQRDWLQGEELERQLAYWKENLKGAPELLELPTDHPRPPVRTYRGRTVQLDLELGLVERLQKLTRREGVTLFMLLNAAYALLLARYTRHDEVVIGFPVANRQRKEFESLVGFFVNMLPLRVDLSGNPGVSELLQRMRRVSLDAYAHQDVPFEKMVAELHPQRDLRYSPIFQVAFVLENVPSQDLRLGECAVMPENSGTGKGATKYDFTLMAQQKKDESLRLDLEYNTDLFEPATIERMLVHYRLILEWMISGSNSGIYEFDLPSEAERKQILGEWNNTATNYPCEKSVHRLFEEQAIRTPDALAVVFGDKMVSYRELNQQANQLARHLNHLGVVQGAFVGLCMERSQEMVVAMLAILKAGGAYIPLDPTYPSGRLGFMVQDTGIQVVVSLGNWAETLPSEQCKDLNVVLMDNQADEIAQYNSENLPLDIEPGEIAYVIYTSGSTGIPKGICIPHRAINRLVCNTDYVHLTPEDRIAQASNMSFDAATFEVWGALLSGARLVGVPQEILLSPVELRRTIREQEINVLFLTTALFNQVASIAPDAFASLRDMLFGGETVTPFWVQTVLKSGAPQRLIHVYGPTETTTYATWHLVREVADSDTTVPIGKPIANTTAYVLDRNLHPVPIGVIGELYIGGAGLAAGYHNRPELTAERFIQNPFKEGEQKAGITDNARLYKTGDLVRRRGDGNIEFVGRIDNQVKLHGYRIELGEIEAAIGQYPDIHQAIVLVHEAQPGEKRVVAYVSPASGKTLKAEKLRDFLREQLPNYMIPSTFVIMDAFPLTANGKIDQRALPNPVFSVAMDHYLAPRNEIETRLVSIWKEILGLEQIGVKDNFFELGGHSLMAMRLFSRIQDEFGRPLPLPLLFKDGTVEAIAESLTQTEKAAFHQGINPVQPEGTEIPLFFIAPGLYTRELVFALAPGRPVYGLTPNENGKVVYRKSVQDTAKILYNNLMNFYPRGPYLLMGHSADGYYALELARLLIQSGQEVAFLGLLDTYFPRPEQWTNLKNRFKSHITDLQDKKIPEVLQYFGKLMRSFSTHWWRRIMRANIVERFIKEDKVLDAVSLLAYTYKPEPFKGQVTLFSTAQLDLYVQGHPMENWAEVISGRFEIIPIPGEHMSMFQPPHVAILAKKIDAHLPLHENGLWEPDISSQTG